MIATPEAAEGKRMVSSGSIESDLSNPTVIVAAARDGDLAAQASLFETYDRRLRGFLIGLCHDPELAADIAQDTFVEMFDKLDRLKDDTSFPAWLHRIALNRLKMQWRRQRLRTVLSLDALRKDADSTPVDGSKPDSVSASIEREAIQQAIDGLSPSLKEALLLSRLAGLTSLEIAQALDITHQAAMKRVSRAIEQFRANYYESVGDD